MKNLKRNSFFIVTFLIVLLMFNKTVCATNDKEITYENLIGKDRYETSILVSQKFYPDGAKNVILVNSTTTTGGAVAQPLAQKINGPVLLIEKETLGETKSEIQRLGAKKAYIIGGTSGITKAVEEELKSLDISTTRLSGKDRYLTAIAVAKNIKNYDKVIICNSKDKGANASAIASIAAKNNIPILYNDSESKLNKSTYIFIRLNSYKIKNIYVVGNGLDNSQEEELEKRGIKINKITGNTPYEVNTKMLEKFDFEYNSVFLVNNTVDAIAANYAAAQKESLLLYSNKKLTTEQLEWVKKNDISKIYYTGDKSIKTPLREVERALGIIKEGITVSDGSDGYPSGTRLISNGIYSFPEFHQLRKVGKNHTLYENVRYGNGTLKSTGCNIFASACVVSGLLGDSSVEPISYLNNLKDFDKVGPHDRWYAQPCSDNVFHNNFLEKYYGLHSKECTTEAKMLEMFESMNGNCAAVGFEPGHYIAIIPIMDDPDGYKFYVIDSAFGYTGKYKSGGDFVSTARANGFSMVESFGVRAVIYPN